MFLAFFIVIGLLLLADEGGDPEHLVDEPCCRLQDSQRRACVILKPSRDVGTSAANLLGPVVIGFHALCVGFRHLLKWSALVFGELRPLFSDSLLDLMRRQVWVALF